MSRAVSSSAAHWSWLKGLGRSSINDDRLARGRATARPTTRPNCLSRRRRRRTRARPGRLRLSPYSAKLAGPGGAAAQRGGLWPSLGVGSVGAASFAARFAWRGGVARRARAVVFVYARAGGVLYIHWHGGSLVVRWGQGRFLSSMLVSPRASLASSVYGGGGVVAPSRSRLSVSECLRLVGL